MSGFDVTSMSNGELEDLRDAVAFELSVRAKCGVPRCLTFWGPGPPGYAAQCRLDEGHAGGHDMGTAEEAREAYSASVDAVFDYGRKVREEAQRRMDTMIGETGS